MPGESYRRRLRSLLLCLCNDVLRAPVNSLACWFCKMWFADCPTIHSVSFRSHCGVSWSAINNNNNKFPESVAQAVTTHLESQWSTIERVSVMSPRDWVTVTSARLWARPEISPEPNILCRLYKSPSDETISRGPLWVMLCTACKEAT